MIFTLKSLYIIKKEQNLLTMCSLIQACLGEVVEEVSAPFVILAPQLSSLDEPWTAATREWTMVIVLSSAPDYWIQHQMYKNFGKKP